MYKFLAVALLPNCAASQQHCQLKEDMTPKLPEAVAPEKYYRSDSTASMDANL